MNCKHFLVYMLCAAVLCSTFALPAEAAKKTDKTEKSSKASKTKKGKRKYILFGKRKAVSQPAAQAPKPSVDRKGLFNVTKMGNDWFFEIPESLLGTQFLTTTRFTSVPTSTGKFAGEQINEQTVYFEKGIDNTLLLRAHLLVNNADTTNVISKAVTISNEGPIIGAFKIESHQGGMYKINVTAFFMDDNPAIGIDNDTKRSFGLANMLGGGMSYIEDIKSFPMNTEVRLVKTYNAQASTTFGSATGKATIGINISFVKLPENPMVPRYYDPRVGYFTVGYNQFSDGQQRVEAQKLIARYRLEPKPEDVEKMRRGELVEPAKQIVYYIDPATPKQWVPYLIQGVNDWQKAFEKAGFKNAIVGKEWPNDETMSMEDARFSMIRYLASPIENAYGPHVSDPRTGEIIEAHVCWYHNVMKLVHDWYLVQASSIDEAAQKMHFDEHLMGELIRFVSSHEVGHSLGLRHNFGASSTVPVDSLRNKQWVEAHGHTPSIMDYARFNYVAQPEDGIGYDGIFPRIGDYDEWAIEWGYKPVLDVADAATDHKLMEKMVTERLKDNPRLWWGDGEGYRSDPRCQTEDLGDDAVKASEYGILNLKREITKLPEWAYDENDIYNQNLSQLWNQIMNQYFRYCGHVINNIGGMNRNLKTNTEEGDVYTPNPRAKQLAAMDFVKRHIMEEPTWLRDVSYARRITDNPQRLTASLATNNIVRLVTRIGSLTSEYTVEEYLRDLTQMIMTEVDTHQKPTDYRKVMQNAYVDLLISLYQSSDITSLNFARGHLLSTLKSLQTKTKSASQSGDTATKAHYLALNDLLNRALEVK